MTEHDAAVDRAIARIKHDRFDQAAWSTLYDRLVPRSRAIAFRLLHGDAALAADVVQDALERLVRYAEFTRFEHTDDLMRYFSTMVRNAALDALRRNRGARGAAQNPVSAEETDGERPGNEIADRSAGPEDLLATRTAVARLQRDLSPREMFLLTLIADGYSRKEIAARLGTTESNAAVLAHRVRARVRELGHLI